MSRGNSSTNSWGPGHLLLTLASFLTLCTVTEKIDFRYFHFLLTESFLWRYSMSVWLVWSFSVGEVLGLWQVDWKMESRVCMLIQSDSQLRNAQRNLIQRDLTFMVVILCHWSFTLVVMLVSWSCPSIWSILSVTTLWHSGAETTCLWPVIQLVSQHYSSEILAVGKALWAVAWMDSGKSLHVWVHCPWSLCGAGFWRISNFLPSTGRFSLIP